MTIGVQWSAFGLGLAVGALGGALFFGGLAAGIRLALGRRHAVGLLLASAALRIALLTGLAALMAAESASSLAGFMAAFVLVRLVALAAARAPERREVSRWS